MDTELIHIGFGNVLAVNRIIAVVSPNSSSSKLLVQEANAKGRDINMTNGRRTKAVSVMDSGHVVLAAITPETIGGRVSGNRGKPSNSHDDGPR